MHLLKRLTKLDWVVISENKINRFNRNIKDYNTNWQRSHDHAYRILITGISGSGKINTLLNLIIQQIDGNDCVIDQTYLHVKNPNKLKIQYLIKKRKNSVFKELEDLMALTEYSHKQYKPGRKFNGSIVFDNIIADMFINKKLN